MKIETQCLHEGYTPKNGEPRVLPIVQSTTYCFDSTEHIAQLFDMPTEFMYSRFANPTVDAVEKKIAALEGGVGAMCTTSGQAATLFSILNLCIHNLRRLRQPVCCHPEKTWNRMYFRRWKRSHL